MWGWDSIVILVTRIGRRRSGGRIPAEYPGRLWVQLSLLCRRYRGTFPGVKWPGLEFDHLAALLPRLRMSGGTYLLPTYAFMAPTGTVLPFMSENVVGITLKAAHRVRLLRCGDR
jgi:hypothetical protein